MSNSQLEKATLGGGCFWCLEAVFQDLKGVESVVSGYAGGESKNPTYQQVCSGITGHAEVVQVEYDPTIITYEDILAIFWRIHDPTTLNRQGADVGTQYRSIILVHDENQQEIAQRSKMQTDTSDLWPNPIVTEIVPLETFYKAEAHHQNYYNDNGNQPYCRVVIDPKVRKFRAAYKDKLKN